MGGPPITHSNLFWPEKRKRYESEQKPHNTWSFYHLPHKMKTAAEIVANAIEDIRSNPLFLYLTTGMANLQARVDTLEKEAVEARTANVALQLQVEYLTGQSTMLQERLDETNSRLITAETAIDGLVQAADQFLEPRNFEDHDDFYNEVVQVEQNIGVAISDYFEDERTVLDPHDDYQLELDGFMEVDGNEEHTT